MYFIHKYFFFAPVCKETHKVSENKTLCLFLLSHISKTTELIQICCGHDDFTQMWAGFTLNSWQRAPTQPIVPYQKRRCIRNNARCVLKVIWSVFTLASIANTQS